MPQIKVRRWTPDASLEYVMYDPLQGGWLVDLREKPPLPFRVVEYNDERGFISDRFRPAYEGPEKIGSFINRRIARESIPKYHFIGYGDESIPELAAFMAAHGLRFPVLRPPEDILRAMAAVTLEGVDERTKESFLNTLQGMFPQFADTLTPDEKQTLWTRARMLAEASDPESFWKEISILSTQRPESRVSGEPLRRLTQNLRKWKEIMKGHIEAPSVVSAIIQTTGCSIGDLRERRKAEAIAQRLRTPNGPDISVGWDPEEGAAQIPIADGTKRVVFDKASTEQPAYKELLSIHTDLCSIGPAPYLILHRGQILPARRIEQINEILDKLLPSNFTVPAPSTQQQESGKARGQEAARSSHPGLAEGPELLSARCRPTQRLAR